MLECGLFITTIRAVSLRPSLSYIIGLTQKWKQKDEVFAPVLCVFLVFNTLLSKVKAHLRAFIRLQ